MERTPKPPRPRDAHPADQLAVLRVYPADERPRVLVHFGGDWQSGELLDWSEDDEGELWARVSYRRPLDQQFVGTFDRERVWQDRDDIARPA